MFQRGMLKTRVGFSLIFPCIQCHAPQPGNLRNSGERKWNGKAPKHTYTRTHTRTRTPGVDGRRRGVSHTVIPRSTCHSDFHAIPYQVKLKIKPNRTNKNKAIMKSGNDILKVQFVIFLSSKSAPRHVIVQPYFQK